MSESPAATPASNDPPLRRNDLPERSTFRRNVVLLAAFVAVVGMFGRWIVRSSLAPRGSGVYTVVVASGWAHGPGNYPTSPGPWNVYGEQKYPIPVSAPSDFDHTTPMLVDPWEQHRYRPGDRVLVDARFNLGRTFPVRTPWDDFYGSLLWLRWKLMGN